MTSLVSLTHKGGVSHLGAVSRAAILRNARPQWALRMRTGCVVLVLVDAGAQVAHSAFCDCLARKVGGPKESRC